MNFTDQNTENSVWSVNYTPKHVINIFLRVVSYLSAGKILANYHFNLSSYGQFSDLGCVQSGL